MIRFYAPDIDRTLTLPADDSKHCVRVLRHVVGDTIEVTDGRGNLYRCVITDANPNGVKVRIEEAEAIANPWATHVTMLIAPPKNMDRMEWLVEKMCEIGVDRIIPVRCSRSERKDLKSERLNKILVSAMKQSLKTVKPTLEEIVTFKEGLAMTAHCEQKFIAYCDEEHTKRELAQMVRSGLSTAILIGPEGDFSPQEVAQAMEAGFRAVTLGPCRLRTETAAFAALQTVHVIEQMKQ